MSRFRSKGRLERTLLAGLLAFSPAVAAPAAGDPDPLEALQRQVNALALQNAQMQQTIQRLERDVEQARDEARAAEDMARAASPAAPSAAPAVPAASAYAGPGANAEGSLLARSLGRANLQLLDLSLNMIGAAGASSAEDEELELLEGGGHDPRQRGFTLQNLELALGGAVDPFFDGQAYLIYFLDPDGESRFEIEEAFARSRMLPFGLEEQGLQLEAGQFFTEFGRLNPVHPHAWRWLDQPVILSRLFGEDGMRGPGVRLGWLSPLPWFSELHLGVQNAEGETMVSFLASEETFEERPVGGRPFADVRVGSPKDLVKLVRWVNGFDLSDTWSSQLGLSFLHGPNATGPGGRTFVYGLDLVAKWRPLQTDRGWPFVIFESELARRSYRADAFSGCPTELEDGVCPLTEADLGEATLRDWGGYAQLLWGFRRNWAVGLRYEYATGDGDDYDAAAGSFVSRDGDPFRDDRHRVSPLLSYRPSEFSRLRLQYNYDRADFLDGKDAHSVWAGLEFSLGPHPAHGY